ncbi:MAG: 3-deoxy-manno-octulosonate cytidylyltransferase (CMP-KDO synthetase) [Saprospiraceae bacterium]|jgi:3-deoxy-manno-octulosonate cytidylyltransferase (CMP-KDO synthetase)
MNNIVKITAIIPARLQSTRLPKKVLAEIAGKSMLQRIYKIAESTKLFDQVIIATDSEIVMNHCIERNMRAKITSEAHKSGTDRIAEITGMLDSDIIINIQADEPFLEKSSLRALVELMKKEDVSIGTLTKRIDSIESLLDYNTVKLVKDINNKVLYFSRQAIPAHRDMPFRDWLTDVAYFQHLGVYGFKRNALLEVSSLSPSILEMTEKLEQLRWIENGYDVYATTVESTSFGIDTEEDLERARAHALSLEFRNAQ